MGTRALALTEALLTQLVFEHSLRIRFKAEGSKETSSSAGQSASPIVTPETQSVEGSTTLEGNDTQSDSTTSSTKGKAKANSPGAKSAAAKDEKKEEMKKDNLVGKINTLVTVDLENVVSAKDFLMVGKRKCRQTQILVTDMRCAQGYKFRWSWL